MSHFAYVRALGIWNPTQVVLHQELQSFDQQLFKAINGDDGGTWAPGAFITIGGAGLQVTTNFLIADTGTFEVDCGALFLQGGLFEGNLGVNGSFLANGIFRAGLTALFIGAVTMDDTLSVAGAFTAGGSVTLGDAFGDNLVVNATAFFNASTSLLHSVIIGDGASRTLTVNAETTFQDEDVILGGSAGLVERPAVIGSNSTSTYSVSTADLIYIPSGSITGAWDYFIDEVGAVNGKTLRFYRADRDSAHPINLKRSSDSSLIDILNWDATGSIWIDCKRIAGRWERAGGEFYGSP